MLIKCFAKINIFLGIFSKRNSGLHELGSVFQNITLFDILDIVKADQYQLIIDSSSPVAAVTADYNLYRNNLLCRIYQYFRERFRIPPVQIKLKKCIPVGAGLGGGSADAAGFITALNKLYKLNLSRKKLSLIGQYFGADIPFFFTGGRAAVEGTGEYIRPIT